MAWAAILDGAITGARLLTGTLSGKVLSGGAPVQRKVVVWKNGAIDEPYRQTESAADGTWSVDVVGNANDRFRVMAIGEPGENSAVFEDVRLS